MKNKEILIFVFMFCSTFLYKTYAQDIDNDGVADSVDNCKFTSNPFQLDNDSDNIGDDCDCDSSISDPLGQHSPAILISAIPSTTINSGTLVNFTSLIDSGGSSPIYQWKKNGIVVGTNISTYSDSLINNGDIISCELTSDVICASGNIKSSNLLVFTVNVLSIFENIYDTENILMYPNPAKKEIFIKTIQDVQSIEVIDLNGKFIKQINIENNKVNTESLNSGVYFFKISINGVFKFKKIVIN